MANRVVKQTDLTHYYYESDYASITPTVPTEVDKSKAISELSTDELRKLINRLRDERDGRQGSVHCGDGARGGNSLSNSGSYSDIHSSECSAGRSMSPLSTDAAMAQPAPRSILNSECHDNTPEFPNYSSSGVAAPSVPVALAIR